jgi:hypothetical protein
MTVFVDHRDAVYSEKLNHSGATQRQFDYFAKKSPQQFGPEAFLVDYGPERVTSAHFHSVDQFQIFFGAKGGRYQRHPIPAVELHYADAFVTYGPFSAGEERIKFFTLRPCQGQFKGNMPEERHKLRYRGRRGVHVDLEPQLAVEPATDEVIVETIIPRDDDGLSATLIIAGPHTEIEIPTADGTSGVYLCVLSGEVAQAEPTIGPMSLGWMAPGEGPTVLRSGSEGSRVLAMAYPYPPTPDSRAAAVR